MSDITKLYLTYFNVRDDAYALRYLNRKSGNIGYYTQCFNRWNDNCHLQRHDGITCRECAIRDYKAVNSVLLELHLAGMEVVAAYPLIQGDERYHHYLA